MTKKDYIKAAKIVQELIDQDKPKEVVDEVEKSFIKFFESNPMFDAYRFIEYCRK